MLAKLSEVLLLLSLTFFSQLYILKFLWLACCYSSSIKQTVGFRAKKIITVNMYILNQKVQELQ